MQNRKHKYNIAISFAEEDRNAALALALALELKGCGKVYYYPNNLYETSGEALSSKLNEIYSKQAQYAVILLSVSYFKKEKKFAQIELQAIEERMRKEPGIVYVIPVKLEKELSLQPYPFLKKLAFLDWNYNPKKIATILLKRLGQKTNKKKKPGRMSKIISQKNNNQTGFVNTQQNNLSIRF